MITKNKVIIVLRNIANEADKDIFDDGYADVILHEYDCEAIKEAVRLLEKSRIE